MFESLKSNSLAQINIVKELIHIHETSSIEKDPDVRKGIKIYAVSACVINLYAIYERFVEDAISDYLDALPELFSYINLPSELRNDYRIGISHILSKIDNERYNHLGHENVIRWYHEALSNTKEYRFVTEALTRHEQNLRLNTLENLFSKIRLTELNAWLSKSKFIVSLYTDNAAIKEQLEAELKIFIQVRNDAAHGGLDTLDGKDKLLRYCELIESLIRSLSEYMYLSLLRQRIEVNRSRYIGKVSEVFPRNNAFVAKMKINSSLRIGMDIHIIGENYCFTEKIVSLMKNDDFQQMITCDTDECEIGIQCQTLLKKNAMIYIDVS